MNLCCFRSITKFVEQCRTRSTCDRISVQVEKLQGDNEPIEMLAATFLELLNKLNSRIEVEKGWATQFIAYMQNLVEKFMVVSAEVAQLETAAVQLKNHIEEILQDELHNTVLLEVVEKVRYVEHGLKNARKEVKLIYAVMRSSRSVFNGKMRYLCRVVGHQQYMKKKPKEVCKLL